MTLGTNLPEPIHRTIRDAGRTLADNRINLISASDRLTDQATERITTVSDRTAAFGVTSGHGTAVHPPWSGTQGRMLVVTRLPRRSCRFRWNCIVIDHTNSVGDSPPGVEKASGCFKLTIRAY
jgi:hypothetical protein